MTEYGESIVGDPLMPLSIGRTGRVLCGSPEYLGAAGVPTHPNDQATPAFVRIVAPDTSKRFSVDPVPRNLICPARSTVDDGYAKFGRATGSIGLLVIVGSFVE